MKDDPAYRRSSCRPPRGFTLLEVILALALLAGAMVVLGQLMSIGTRSAAHARHVSTAQILCESKMAELAAGIVPLEPVQGAAFEHTREWRYSVVVSSTEEERLFAVRVIVEQNVERQKQPFSFALDRWVIDPGLELLEDGTEAGQSDDAGNSVTSTEGNNG
jgi:type II secretion system protein I